MRLEDEKKAEGRAHPSRGRGAAGGHGWTGRGWQNDARGRGEQSLDGTAAHALLFTPNPNPLRAYPLTPDLYARVCAEMAALRHAAPCRAEPAGMGFFEVGNCLARRLRLGRAWPGPTPRGEAGWGAQTAQRGIMGKGGLVGRASAGRGGPRGGTPDARG